MRSFSRFSGAVGIGIVVLLTSLSASAQSLNNARANYTRAVALYDAGKYEESRIACEEALRQFERLQGRDSASAGDCWNILGNAYCGLGQYSKSEAAYLRSLQIRERFGKTTRFVGDTLLNLALLYNDMTAYAKAEPLMLRSLQILERQADTNPLDVASRSHSLGKLYLSLAQHAKAESYHLRGLRIREGKLGKNHADTAASLHYLAMVYQDMGEYARAEPLYRRSLQIREATLGKDHSDTAASVQNLANLYESTSEYAKAEPLYRRSLETFEAKLGKDHLDTATALNNFAAFYVTMGHYAKAEPLYYRSLQIRENKLGKDHLDIAHTLNNLAHLYELTGQYAKSETLFHRSLEIMETKVGKDHPDTAIPVSNLAILYENMGDYAKAEALHRRSLEIREAKLGKDHADTATSLENLGRFNQHIGQYAKAELLFRRSLEIREAKFGKDHPTTAHSMNNLGCAYDAMGQYAKAETLYRRSLEIDEAKLGKDHHSTAISLINLALVYENMGQYAKAEPLLIRALDIHEAKLGKDHPNTARSLGFLGNFYRTKREYAKAEPLFVRGLHIQETKLGKDDQRVGDLLGSLAGIAAEQQQWTKAIEYNQRSSQIGAKYLAGVLPGLSEAEQLTLLKTKVAKDFHWSLSLGRAAPKEAAAPSAEWLLNFKALAHQSLAEQQMLARDAKDSEAQRLLESLQQTRSRLAVLTNCLPSPGMETQYQRDMQTLRASEQDLAEKLARKVGRAYRPNPWVALDELRAKLGPKTAFVDIARFLVTDFTTKKDIGPRYVAWITPPPGKGDVQLVDLGNADAIDKLIADTRTTLLLSAKSVGKVGEIEASGALQKPLQALSAKVLHPLLPTLTQYEDWIVCPDGALWLTPWSALLLPDGKFVVEKHLLRHVVSGRDLVLELPKAKAESAYIFADPDYDLSPHAVLLAAEGLRGIGGSSLLGQRLQGAIGVWKVSFEFLQDEILIHDDEDNGKVVGKGTWKQEGNALTMQTGISLFQGTIEGNKVHGQRSKRNADGTTTRDTFRMETRDEIRSAGAIDGTLPKVPRLPGTAVEAEAMRPKIKDWLGQEPKVYLEGQASEANVKAIKNPRVLTLATHGYFLPAQEVESRDQSGSDLPNATRTAALFDQKGQRIENPLLRCGLLLAGCNRRAEAKAGEDNGILTGLEIVGMNLNGCELVVLSACETGLGDVRNGEGVAGLRQAFQLAGAKAVLASLWQVPDRETALLMNTFYGEIAKARSQAAALREAQLQRIAARRSQFGAAHPFFWAAFALTSRGTE